MNYKVKITDYGFTGQKSHGKGLLYTLALLSKSALVIWIVFLFFTPAVFGQNTTTPIQKHYLREGNKEYEKKDYDKAQTNYFKALNEDGKNFESNYNLGDALYKKEDYNGAAAKFEVAAAGARDNTQKAQAFHNLGNANLKANRFEPAIDAYKNALKINPGDKDTKYNLSLALAKLQAEKKKNKDQDKDKKKGQNKDKDKDKNKGGGKDNKDQNGKDKNQQGNKGDKDKDKQQNGQNGDKDKQQQQGKQGQGQMSNEEAERILNALKGEEQKVQKRILLKNAQDKKTNPKSKQW